MSKTFYLCDGRANCNGDHANCYLNGGDCSATDNIEHAKNFHVGPDNKSYWETGSRYKSPFSEELSEKEKGFLITCILTAANEDFRYSPRFYKMYSSDSEIKLFLQRHQNDILNRTEVIDLIRKLGGDKDDLQEFCNRYKK